MSNPTATTLDERLRAIVDDNPALDLMSVDEAMGILRAAAAIGAADAFEEAAEIINETCRAALAGRGDMHAIPDDSRNVIRARAAAKRGEP